MATTPDRSLPLLGLLDDTVLPGETRRIVAPSLDVDTLQRLAAQAPPRVAVVCITSAVELPSLVSTRWCTDCEVVAAEADGITLRGVRRLRLKSAQGRAAPYAALFEAPAQADGDADLATLTAAAQEVLATLHAGALPDRPEAREAVRDAVYTLLRAVWSRDDVRDAAAMPVQKVIAQAARTLAARERPREAAETLERAARELFDKPDPSPAQRRRLWSQVVEIQRRLDVYEPDVGAEEGDEIGRMQRRLMQAGLPKAAREVARRELRLLRTMKTDHHDYSTYLAHLDLMARLPWHPDPPAPIDLDAVQRALDRDHAGLEKPKRRVLEYLAVRALGGETTSTVLCLAGPPGVGKTTIARAVAEALGRKFVRVALGGVHDESEVRGHRITFTAASAGRILAGVAQAGSASAVVLLDEIDKMGTDKQRSPAAAMLEVLDPAQNTHFHDNYLGVPYDLSPLLFICTANDLGAMHPTLRDRMEVVELEGYSLAEKLSIARDHLLQRVRAKTGLPAALPVDDEVLTALIEGHTREAGVRQLERCIGSLYRARALALVRAPEGDAATRPVTRDEVRAVLGPGRPSRATQPALYPPGVTTGLSVSTDGGATLPVEVGRLQGRGKLVRTGRLGKVLRESVSTALAHLRLDAKEYTVPAGSLDGDFYVHLPDAATEKDGPSAGVAIFVALLSLARDVAVPTDTAFTGEISLRGRVLAVGGVAAKLAAAKRAGIRRVVVPLENRADVPDEPGLEVVLVDSVREVVACVFGEAARA